MKLWIAVLIIGVPFFSGCSEKPPLRIIESWNKVTVDVQTLGEYRTTVMRIRLMNKTSGQVVWELKTQSGTPQIHQIELKIGENPAILNGVLSGTYAVVTPDSTATFSLAADREYEIQLWGGESESSKVTRTFRLTNKPLPMQGALFWRYGQPQISWISLGKPNSEILL